MKALLESSIRWNNIQKHPKDSYRYHVRQATIEKETNILSLEVGLNFIPSKEDEQRMGLLLRSQFPQISHVNIQLTYMEKLPGSAEVLRLVEEAPVPGNGKNGMRGAKGGWQKQESPIVGNRLMGKKIDEPSVPIAEIIPGTGAATIEGQIFKKEARAIKGGKQLLSLLITDFTDSACIKAFVSEKKWAQMDELLKEGDYIKVRGSVEFDSFENADVMKARDMEKLTVTEATDAAVEKRVELHAHTKMSAMDGLIDVQDLIETAAGWGHKAIAITDHGVVQAFPDAAKYVEEKVRHKGYICLEGYLVDMNRSRRSKFDYKAVPSYHHFTG